LTSFSKIDSIVTLFLVVIVNLQVALDTAYWTLINHFFIWGSILLYFGLHFFMYSNGVFALFPWMFPFVGVGRFVIDKVRKALSLTFSTPLARILADSLADNYDLSHSCACFSTLQINYEAYRR